MSSKLLQLESAISASHVPETEPPFCIRADQVPCQPRADFRAAQVPSRTIWLTSLRSVQEPWAAFLVSGRTWADHLPRKTRFGPGAAIQLPRSTGRKSLLGHGAGSNHYNYSQAPLFHLINQLLRHSHDQRVSCVIDSITMSAPTRTRPRSRRGFEIRQET